MVSSRLVERFGLLALFVATASCAQGVGEGSVAGVVSAPSCHLSPTTPFELAPTYFAAEAFGASLNIRLQHGTDIFDYSNVFFISVLDSNDVKLNQLGVPLAVSDADGAPVRISLALNETCPFHARNSIPVSYQAVSGTITFSDIYAPDVGSGRTTAAVFDSVHLVDPSAPTERYADVSGYFQFVYTRGRPAQVFP